MTAPYMHHRRKMGSRGRVRRWRKDQARLFPIRLRRSADAFQALFTKMAGANVLGGLVKRVEPDATMKIADMYPDPDRPADDDD
jgi:hypothetical protein